MKTKYSKIAGYVAALALGTAMTGCNDYLDIEPPSQVPPESYFSTPDQLAAYTLNYYINFNDQSTGYSSGNIFPHHGIGGSSYGTFLDEDQGSDNESGTDNRFFDGNSKHKVGNEGGSWSFGTINNMNYFIRTVMPKYEAGEIKGSDIEVRHYIGEAYLIRSIEYFKKLREVGDFPIVTETQPLDKEVLTEHSKRMPRNKVARFIIASMDTAINMLSDGSLTGGRNRITRDVALLYKARVALYEATWEKYFAGTPFVPDKNAGWPGAKKDYNADFTYDNTAEVNYFLDQALAASKEVADNHPTLTANSKQITGLTATSFPANPYYDLFSSQDVSGYDEALMYRSYDLNIGGGHCMNQYITGGRGFTQEFANCFLMENGLPIYAAGSNYAGDDFIADTRKDRDWRWQLFTKEPNQYVYKDNSDQRVGCGKKNKRDKEYKAPSFGGTGGYFSTSTGYHKAKGWANYSDANRGGHDLTAAVIFRSAEAYLIYMEACWERKGDNLDADAWKYWSALRVRAGLPADAHVTINATDLDKEEETSHDFALYSAGKRITSKVLYNIRRERRCELMGEGFRMDDLFRWRALDQLKTKRYFKHGCKVFGPMIGYFTRTDRDATMTDYTKMKFQYLKFDQEKDNNISSPSDTEGALNGDARYFSLLRTDKSNDWYASGYTWRMAHYLSPIAEDHFVQTAPSGNLEDSPIYQNPYWGMIHDTPAQQ